MSINQPVQPQPHLPPQSGPPQPPPPKRKVWPWVLLGLIIIPVLLIGGCTLLFGGAVIGGIAASESTLTDEPTVETTTDEPTSEPTTEMTKAKVTPTKKAMTKSQEQAIGSAQDYLDYGAFSRKGLIEQLHSDAGEGFSKADATFAVDYLKVNWNKQAAKSAKEYLDYGHFSRSGLIEQLESDAGEGFTHSQAVYGVNAAGL